MCRFFTGSSWLSVLLLGLILSSSPVLASDLPMMVTYVAGESAADTRHAYNKAALRLALEKTRPEYGDYRMVPAPNMNTARALEEALRGTFPNLFVMTTFQNQLLDSGLDYARFPVDMGITGYRICFVSPSVREAVAGSKTLEELRRFRIGQGVGWADVAILRHNRFNVVVVPRYEDLFLQVTNGNFDLFCRGINELEAEYSKRRATPGLDYDRRIAFHYPLPRFFFTAKCNRLALERVSKGLHMAYKDGSLSKLWREHYQHAVSFSKLKQRHVFLLETPNIDRIDFDYRRYFFDPHRD